MADHPFQHYGETDSLAALGATAEPKKPTELDQALALMRADMTFDKHRGVPPMGDVYHRFIAHRRAWRAFLAKHDG